MKNSVLILFTLLLFNSSIHAQKAGKYSEGLAWVYKNKKYGFKNTSGKIVIPFLYDSVFSFSEGVTPVKKNGKWFYINKKGKAIHVNEFDNKISKFKMARPYFYGLAVVSTEWEGDEGITSMTVIDISGGGAWVDFSVDSLGDFDKGYAIRKNGNTYNFLDHCQRLLLAEDYEKIDSFSKGYAKVWYNESWRVLNPYGECISNCKGFPSLPYQDANDFSTIYFSCYSYVLSEISKNKLDLLAAKMKSNPDEKYVLMGNGYSSYSGQQESWMYTMAVIKYLIEIKKIEPERIIFQYGGTGRQRTVNIRQAEDGEEGPNITPQPFPGFNTCTDY